MQTKQFNCGITKLIKRLGNVLIFCLSSVFYLSAQNGSSDDSSDDINFTIYDSLHVNRTITVGNTIAIGTTTVGIPDNIFTNGPTQPLFIQSSNLDNHTIINAFNNGMTGIGTQIPNFKLDVLDNINVNPSSPNNGYRIDGIPVLQKPGTNNIFVGEGAGFNNMGTDNTFVGYNAGEGNTFHIENTFIGSQTGVNNFSAAGTFLGYRAGNANTSGTCNTFLGWEAGENTKT